MRLLIIRHGEPIYNPDTLTEKGKKEAKILASFLKKNFPEIKDFYLSPLGRAQETAKPILEAFGNPVKVFSNSIANSSGLSLSSLLFVNLAIAGSLVV